MTVKNILRVFSSQYVNLPNFLSIIVILHSNRDNRAWVDDMMEFKILGIPILFHLF